jgi:hypothetical protein
LPAARLRTVSTRSEWNRRELGQLLKLNGKGTTDLLETFGFESVDDDEELWRVSTDRKRSKLRRHLRHEDD